MRAASRKGNARSCPRVWTVLSRTAILQCMRAFRFLHIADVHFDRSFATKRDKVRAALRDAMEASFAGAIDLALSESVDAVLVAGDLFDHTECSYRTERFLRTQIERLNGSNIKFLYATGNHDPGPALRRMAWPEGVLLFDQSAPRRIGVEHGGRVAGYVTAAGHARSTTGANLAAAFPVAERDGSVPEIAMLHATVSGSLGYAGHGKHAPCSQGDLIEKGYDYWALGHIHLRQSVLDEGAAHYPGGPLGLSRRETGEKGALLVSIEPGAPPDVAFHPTAPLRWESIHADLTGVTEWDGVHRAIRRAIDTSLEVPASETLLTIKLEGATPLATEIRHPENTDSLTDESLYDAGLRDLFLETASLRRPVDRERFLVEPIRSMCELVTALRSGEENIESIAPPRFAGAPLDPNRKHEYLLSLLEGAEDELVDRMWKERS